MIDGRASRKKDYPVQLMNYRKLELRCPNVLIHLHGELTPTKALQTLTASQHVCTRETQHSSTLNLQVAPSVGQA